MAQWLAVGCAEKLIGSCIHALTGIAGINAEHERIGICVSKVFCKRACRHHPGWYFRRGMYLVVPEYSLVCNWELIAYYFNFVVEFVHTLASFIQEI